MRKETRPLCLTLSGGLALGAYQAGVFAALAASATFHIESVAGSSIGAFNAAIIAGNRPDARTERLRAFWNSISRDHVTSAFGRPWRFARPAFAD